MSTIFDVVLYRYASAGTITPGFDREFLGTSFIAKSAQKQAIEVGDGWIVEGHASWEGTTVRAGIGRLHSGRPAPLVIFPHATQFKFYSCDSTALIPILVRK